MTRTRGAASKLQARATAKGLHAVIERDGKHAFEVEVPGFKDRAAARAERTKVRGDGFARALVERS
jgi:hypothetical protein